MRARSMMLVALLVLAVSLTADARGRDEMAALDRSMEANRGPRLLSSPGGDTTCVFFEDFQDGESGWQAVDLLAPAGQPIYWKQAAYDHGDGAGERGVMWCGDSIETWISPPGYGDNWHQYLTKEFNLGSGSLQNYQVGYEIQYDTEPDYDFVYLDVSTNGGSEYVTLETWDGYSDGFIADTTSLAAYEGEIIILRFRFDSDNSYSDEDGMHDSNGAIRLDWVEVTGYPRDDFDSGTDGWTASVLSGSLHSFGYRLEEDPGCESIHPCEDYCWSWVAWEETSGVFPWEKDLVPIDIGIESPTFPIPDDGSEYILKFDVYANLPQANLVFYRWEVATPPSWHWENDNTVYYANAGFVTSVKNITSELTSGADSIKVRLSGVDLYDEWHGSYSWSGVHTAAPMFDNVRIYVRDTAAEGVPDVPAPCGEDLDGDGVYGSADLCQSENASWFDSFGDGCIDPGAGARHIEYWDRDDFPLTFYIHENGAPSINDGSDTTAIIQAYDAWCLSQVEADAQFGGTTAQADANAFDGTNLVTFEDPDYDFGAGVIAVGLTTSFEEPMFFNNRWWRPGQIMDSDVIFNPDMDFRTATDGPAEGIYIESVAAHEVGHVFGLSHTPVRSSTMYFVLPPGLEAATLEADDRTAMIKAYGTDDLLSMPGWLTGTVTDGYTGSPVPGAAVFAIDAATGDTSACEYTLADGTYSFIGLDDGEYYVAIHPLDGSSAMGYLHPGYVNAMVETSAVVSFVPEYWDLSESAHDESADKDPLMVYLEVAGAVADIVTNIDDTPPQVTLVVPDSGTVDVSIDTSVLVVFSERINSATLQGNFNLTDAGTQEFVPGNATLLNDDSLLAFVPLSELSFSTTYQLLLEPGIEDMFGNGLPDTFATIFTTEEEPAVALSSLAPSKGVVGMTISLNGKGFAPVPENNTVSFNGATADIAEASVTQLVVTVPEGAVSGPVTVYNHIQDLTSNDLQFTVLSADEVPRGFHSGTCDLGGVPYDLTPVSTGDYVFVATDLGAEVVDVDPGSGGYMTSTLIPVPGGLTHVDAGPAGDRVYGVSSIENRFYRLSSTPGSMGLLSEKPINAGPRGIIVHPRGHRAYIPTGEGEIQIWDIQESSPTFETQIGHIAPVDPNVRGELATYPAGDVMLSITGTGKMFVANLDSGEVTDTIQVGTYPKDVAIDPLGNLAYTSDEMGYMSVISLTAAQSLWTVKIGGTPDGIALTPAGSFALVVNRELDLLSAVDLRPSSPGYLNTVATIELPVNPTDVELSPDGDYAYTISEADMQLVATSLGVGPSLQTLCPEAGPEGARLVLAGSGFSADPTPVVSFDGQPASPERITDSSLAVQVPPGAESGEVSVLTEVAGADLESNRIYFQVLGATSDGMLRAASYLDGTPSPSSDGGPILAASPDGRFLLIADLEGQVYAMVTDYASPDYHRYVGSVDLETNASDLAIAPGGERSFAVLPDSDRVAVLLTDPLSPYYLSVVGEVDFSAIGGSEIARAAVTPDGSILLVSDPGAAEVHFVDIIPGSPTEYEITASTALGGGPSNGEARDLAFHPGGEVVYLAVDDSDPAVVLILDTDPLSPLYQTVVYALTLPGTPPQETPVSPAFTPDGDRCLALTSQKVGSPHRTLLLLDSSDPAVPYVSAELDLGGSAPPVDEYVTVSPRGDRAVAGIRLMGLLNVEILSEPDSLALVQQTGQISHHSMLAGGAYSPDASLFYSLSGSSDTLVVYDFTEADTIALHSGDGQSAVVGQALARPLCVEVSGGGSPASGVGVRFEVTSGGGSFAGSDSTVQTVSTGADGRASVTWVLGPDVGSGAHTAEAGALGLEGSPVVFTADGVVDPNTLPLEVESVVPDSGATGVSIVTAAQISFSRSVDTTTVRDTTLYLHDGDYYPLASVFGFADDNRKVSLTPLRSLDADVEYWIEATTCILDLEGGPLSQPLTASFETQSPPPLMLKSAQPPSATEGSAVVLSGSGFDEDYWNHTVYFDDLEATILSGGVDYLNTVVPIGASTCSLQVRRLPPNPGYSNKLKFTVIPKGASPINNVTGSVATSSATRSVAITPDGAVAYAVSPDANLVTVIDLENLVSLTSIAVGENPVAIAIDPAGEFAYVANYIDGTVSVIDIRDGSPDRNEVVDAFTVGIGPADLAITPDGDRLVVANSASGGLSLVDTEPTSETYRSVVSTVATGSGTRTVAITPDGGLIYVGNDLGYLVVSAVSYGVVSSINTGAGSRTVAITPDGGLLVILTTEGVINIYDINPESLDYNQVVASVRTGSGSSTIAISPDGAFIYMIQEVGDVIFVGLISLTSPDGAMGGGGEAPQMELQVTVVDTVVAGEDPACVAFDPSASGSFVVSNAGDYSITVLGGSQSAVKPPDLPLVFRIFPNPYKETAHIRFSVSEATDVDLAIYDVRGRMVWRTANARMVPGVHTLAWDGRDSAGRPTAGGVYFARLKIGNAVRTGKMVMLR